MKRSFLGFAVLILSAAAVCQISSTASSQQGASAKPLTIENIFAEGGFTGRVPENLEWSPDGTKFSFVQRDDAGEHGELWYVDALSGEKKILVSEAKLSSLAPPINNIKDEREKERITRYHVAAYVWAPDSKRLLFDSQGQLWLFNLASSTAVQATSAADPSLDPKFSPDGSRLAYVRQHNLYVRSISENYETALTKDTSDNQLNGEVDWVYSEELSTRSNYFWAPDGKNIAFLQMDETKVPTYPITNWMPTDPVVDQQKYPKAGDPNPVVRIGVVGAGGGNIKWISLTDDHDTYIPRFGWVRDGLLWAEVLNRAQNKMDLYFIDSHSGHSRKVLTESDPDGWINVNDDFRILGSGDRFLWSSWRDGDTQLYLYSFDKQNPMASDAKLERQLTKGDFEMLSLAGVDNDAGTVYFTCNKDDPRQVQLYSVKLDGSDMQKVSKEPGTHAAVFADNGKHYADTFSTQMTAPGISVCSSDGACHNVWQSRGLDSANLIPPKFMELKADDGTTTLYGALTLPPNAQAGAKIPLIVFIYGGPAEQTVTDFWQGGIGLFHQILAQQGFAIFTVDNRGTPARDRKFQISIRREFGALELKDQLVSLKQLYAQYPQLDSARTGIWGWSNGGSMTLYSLTHSQAFKAGVSVAPVTDLKNYDSIYNERYWGLPKDEPALYGNPIWKSAPDLSGSLLIVHGTSDDNVHFGNSIQMINALIEAGKQFHVMIYPNKTHSISGSAARTNLFHMIQDHFTTELMNR
jgi:dipeptidyl-peptidase-4